MQRRNQPWLSIAVIVGFASMAAAVATLSQTDRGKKFTRDARKKAREATESATTMASDYMETNRVHKSRDSSDLGEALYETWGRFKSHGRAIENVEVHLEDGSSYRLKADTLDEGVKRGLMGRAHRL